MDLVFSGWCFILFSNPITYSGNDKSLIKGKSPCYTHPKAPFELKIECFNRELYSK